MPTVMKWSFISDTELSIRPINTVHSFAGPHYESLISHNSIIPLSALLIYPPPELLNPCLDGALGI